MRYGTLVHGSFICLLSQVACTPTEAGDTDASTSEGSTGGDASTSGDASTGGDAPTTGAEASTGSGSTTGDVSTTTGETTGDATTGDATTGDALDCSTPGTVRIVAPDLGIDIHDEDAMIDVFDMQATGILGVADGMQYYFWRDGDVSDGTLGPGTHDVSEYPYHVVLQIGPADVIDCEGDPQCQVLYALGGAWDIASAQPLVGTLDATDVTADGECWDDGPPLDTSGCRLSNARLQACFNVAW